MEAVAGPRLMSATAEAFEAERPRLTAVALRLLGSRSDAEDAVQEAWLRLSRSDPPDDLPAWLTTVVSRLCLDELRGRARRPVPVEQTRDEADPSPGVDPGAEAADRDDIGAALVVVLDTLRPRERVAFVLHDLFDVPLPQVADVLGVTHTSARQLASRARRRARDAEPGTERADTRVVAAFLRAARGGDLAGLLAVLSEDVVLDADAAAAALGSPSLRGRETVAAFFDGAAQVARPTLVDGRAGLVWSHQGEARVLFTFDLDGDLVRGIHLVADPEALRRWSEGA